MSGAGPCGRETPRWSAVGAVSGLAASMAGLPGSNGNVNVNPPLSLNGPSSGSVLFSPVPEVHTGVASDERLWPRSVMTPTELPAAFPARMLPKMLNVPLRFASAGPTEAPMVGLGNELLAIVQWDIELTPFVRRTAVPSLWDQFPAKVELVIPNKPEL